MAYSYAHLLMLPAAASRLPRARVLPFLTLSWWVRSVGGVRWPVRPNWKVCWWIMTMILAAVSHAIDSHAFPTSTPPDVACGLLLRILGILYTPYTLGPCCYESLGLRLPTTAWVSCGLRAQCSECSCVTCWAWLVLGRHLGVCCV